MNFKLNDEVLVLVCGFQGDKSLLVTYVDEDKVVLSNGEEYIFSVINKPYSTVSLMLAKDYLMTPASDLQSLRKPKTTLFLLTINSKERHVHQKGTLVVYAEDEQSARSIASTKVQFATTDCFDVVSLNSYEEGVVFDNIRSVWEGYS